MTTEVPKHLEKKPGHGAQTNSSLTHTLDDPGSTAAYQSMRGQGLDSRTAALFGDVNISGRLGDNRSNTSEVRLAANDIPRDRPFPQRDYREENYRMREQIFIDRRMQEIEQRYNVRFARPGETMSRSQPFGHTDTFTARQPTVRELDGIEASLHSQGPRTDGQPPTRIFIASGQNHELGGYNPHNNTVVLFMGGRDNLPATVRDGRAQGNRDGSSTLSVEEIMSHALHYRTQGQSGQDQTSFANDLGFVSRPGAFGSRYQLLGRDGFTYEPHRSVVDGKPVTSWRRTDSQGRYVDGAGKPVDLPDQAHTLSNEQMRQNSVHRPASEHFDTPQDFLAGLSVAYSAGGTSRAELLAQNPTLYAFIKNQDQADINRRYGVGTDGQPNMIRLPDGSIVRNTAAIRAQIEDFERRWRR